MKRLHVHVSVSDLDQSVRFYSTLFDAEPTVLKGDYAKWMLDDPRVNFAISKRGADPGLAHLGIQVENAAELDEVFGRLAEAELPIVEERATTCCYANSDKQWIADPEGIAWETFLTHGESTVYGRSAASAPLNDGAGTTACCGPSKAALAGERGEPKPACCPATTA